MKILVAGASGAIGRNLCPLLIDAGHDVVAISRLPLRGETQKHAMRWHSVDVYDRRRLTAVIEEELPDTVVHQMTDLRNQNPQANAKLRTLRTRNLVDAAITAGVQSIVAQSIAWAYAAGADVATASTPLDVAAPASRLTIIEGKVALESAVSEMNHHVILRYGTFYGPGTWYARDGSFAQKVQAGDFKATAAITNFSMSRTQQSLRCRRLVGPPDRSISLMTRPRGQVSGFPFTRRNFAQHLRR